MENNRVVSNKAGAVSSEGKLGRIKQCVSAVVVSLRSFNSMKDLNSVPSRTDPGKNDQGAISRVWLTSTSCIA